MYHPAAPLGDAGETDAVVIAPAVNATIAEARPAISVAWNSSESDPLPMLTGAVYVDQAPPGARTWMLATPEVASVAVALHVRVALSKTGETCGESRSTENGRVLVASVMPAPMVR